MSNYLKAKVMTASPDELRMMLYDAALRFAEQGKVALDKKDYSESFTRLTKAQNCVSELQNSIVHQDEALQEKMRSLYSFAYLRLVDANVTHATAPVDEAVRILQYQRETWRMIMERRDGPAIASRPQRLSLAG